jgi:hypothetical protein
LNLNVGILWYMQATQLKDLINLSTILDGSPQKIW